MYAELGGVTYPVSRDTESKKYQITFVDDHRKFPAGVYNVKIYDEDGFAAYRKVGLILNRIPLSFFLCLFILLFRLKGMMGKRRILSLYSVFLTRIR